MIYSMWSFRLLFFKLYDSKVISDFLVINTPKVVFLLIMVGLFDTTITLLMIYIRNIVPDRNHFFD